MRALLPYTALRDLIIGLSPPRIEPNLVRTRSLTRTTRASKTFNMSHTDPTIRYNWVDGVENIESYEVGGYYPVMIDDVIRSRYTIVDKLGFGGYSTV